MLDDADKEAVKRLTDRTLSRPSQEFGISNCSPCPRCGLRRSWARGFPTRMQRVRHGD